MIVGIIIGLIILGLIYLWVWALCNAAAQADKLVAVAYDKYDSIEREDCGYSDHSLSQHFSNRWTPED